MTTSEITIYWDDQDPNNAGWAWRTDGESGAIDDEAIIRALEAIYSGTQPADADTDALRAAYPDCIFYTSGGSPVWFSDFEDGLL